MLKEIAIVTITVTNLGQVQSSWEQHFNYSVADQGTVSTELSNYWQASATDGQDYVVMQPADAAPVYVRFVADDAVAAYTPMTSHGWNATELLISDPDKLATQIRDSGFEIVGEPKDLWPAPDAPRAMQAVGPGRELLYLTRNKQVASALGLDASMPPVERVFIMVLGGPSMGELTDFYGGDLELQTDPPSFFKISTISRANDLDMETTYPLATVRTAPGYLVELDELPESIGPRHVEPNHLPPGIAIVGFHSDGINAEVEWVTPLQTLSEFPYNGRSVGIIRGAAGELIEVIIKPE